MWKLLDKNGNDVSFIEGEYGLALPIPLKDVEVSPADTVKIEIKSEKNGDTILEKIYTDIVDNKVDLVLSKAESDLLPVGNYVYNLDWYLDGSFNGTLINGAKLRVLDKA